MTHLADYKIEKIEEKNDIAVTVVFYEGDMQDVQEEDLTTGLLVTVNRYVRSSSVFKDTYHFPFGTAMIDIEASLNTTLSEVASNNSLTPITNQANV